MRLKATLQSGLSLFRVERWNKCFHSPQVQTYLDSGVGLGDELLRRGADGQAAVVPAARCVMAQLAVESKV